MVGSLYALMAAIFGAGFWLVHQPPAQAAITALVLSMPGPGPIWQGVEVLATAMAVVTAVSVSVYRLRSRPLRSVARVRVEVLAGGPDPGIPAGQLVFRRFDSPALVAPAARPALRDGGGVEVEALLFGVVPSLLLVVALVTAATGNEHVRQTVWPLLAGALLLAWLGRHLRRPTVPRTIPAHLGAAPDHLSVCES